MYKNIVFGQQTFSQTKELSSRAPSVTDANGKELITAVMTFTIPIETAEEVAIGMPATAFEEYTLPDFKAACRNLLIG